MPGNPFGEHITGLLFVQKWGIAESFSSKLHENLDKWAYAISNKSTEGAIVVTEWILWISLCNLILELGMLCSLWRAEVLPHHPLLSCSHTHREGNQWEEYSCNTEYIGTLAFMITCVPCGVKNTSLRKLELPDTGAVSHPAIQVMMDKGPCK